MDVEEYRAMYVAEKTNWWFVGKSDLIKIILRSIVKSKIKDTKIISILDVGCGTGTRLEEMSGKYEDVIGIDISHDALRYARMRGCFNMICANAQSLPIKTESLDVVLLLDVLEHIEEDYTAIKEVYRVLREDGFLIITVPAHKFLWSLHDKYLHHKRRYNKDDLCYILEKNKFEIKRLTYWNMFMFFPVTLMVPFRNVVEFMSIRKKRRYLLPDLLNSILLSVLRIENKKIVMGNNLPFGTSIVCIAKKL
ncbi:MAG: class I SAM-dependent methyltransferase [Nanoarchaeota archaeon]|nr:class I SAM-dependent methyltransferase [Nanoarchaeota archaeon]